MKHAPNVQGCAAMVARLLEAAGVPQGAFTQSQCTGDCRSRASSPTGALPAVTLTGQSGRRREGRGPGRRGLQEIRARARRFRCIHRAGRCKDLEAAVAAGVRARFTNCGQVCLAAKRFIIEASVAEEFTARFAAAAAALRRGDPLQGTTQLGPMARADLREQLEAQVATSVQAGAKLVTGGHRAAGAGWYYEPTVLTNVTDSMPVASQEVFGPVGVMRTVRDASDAIAMANDSAFGLSAMLWTADLDRARQMAGALEVGSVFINSVTGIRSARAGGRREAVGLRA